MSGIQPPEAAREGWGLSLRDPGGIFPVKQGTYPAQAEEIFRLKTAENKEVYLTSQTIVLVKNDEEGVINGENYKV